MMFAIQAYFEPELMNSKEEYIEDEEMNRITPKEICLYYEEYFPYIRYCADWDEGLFSISASDYQLLPATLIDFYRIYRNSKAEYLLSKRK